MSGTIGNGGGGNAGWGLLGQLAANATGISTRLERVTEQISTGLVSQTYSGLGSSAVAALDLRPQVAHQAAIGQGISAAGGQLTVAQDALSQIGSIAGTIQAQLATLNTASPTQVGLLSAQARAALQQVASLLDTKDGDSYVFAGQDGTNPPVPDPGSILTGSYFGSISATVGSLSATGAAQAEGNTVATASSNDSTVSVFSLFLSKPVSALQGSPSSLQSVRTGPNSSTSYGVLATAGAVSSTTGSLSTGSYMRDLLRTLAVVGSMSTSQAGSAPLATLAQDTASQMGSAVSAMTDDQGVLGEQQSMLSATGTQVAAAQVALRLQLSGVEDVDMASASTTLSLLQTQLQSSYEMIASVKSLSLVSFLQ